MSLAAAECCDAAGPSLEWDRTTMVLVQRGGNYGRIARDSRGLVCCFEFRRRVWVRRSADDGRTWGEPVDVAGYDGGAAANPELLPLHDGRLLLMFNGRPRRPGLPFTIALATSADGGATWTTSNPPLYTAGTAGGDGCYEPAAVQLPSGEVQLFFANEHGHAADHTQEIDQIRSTDGGRTWYAPSVVSYRRGGRDGMPVPLLSVDGRSVLLAIEDNGLGDHQLRPAILRLPLWPLDAPIGGHDDRRWPAVTDPPWPRGAYAGAPYLARFPAGGPTVLACQSDAGHRGVQRLAVYVGDADAHEFAGPTEPLPIDPGRGGQWNSLFVKSPAVVTAVSSTTVNGVAGVWAIDGHLPAGRR